MLPDPIGDDDQLEQVTLINVGATDVDVSNWTLRDKVNQTWSLSSVGIVPAGEQRTIVRRGQRMGLNNSGDTVVLLDENEDVRHTVTYGRVEAGEVVVAGG